MIAVTDADITRHHQDHCGAQQHHQRSCANAYITIIWPTATALCHFMPQSCRSNPILPALIKSSTAKAPVHLEACAILPTAPFG